MSPTITHPPLLTPVVQYCAIIDAGSSGSRLFIYKWYTKGGSFDPSTITPIFPVERRQGEVDGGLHTIKDREAMTAYLRPLLSEAQAFIEQKLTCQGSNCPRLPIYLIGTAGMRSVSMDEQQRILRLAHGVMQSFGGPFSAGNLENNARVITGNLEGLYAWVALNYGNKKDDPVLGLTELGGISLQFAFAKDKDQDTHEVCLPWRQDPYHVFSTTWEGYGGDAMRRNLYRRLSAEQGSPEVLDDPCLPAGAPDMHEVIPDQWSLGTGEFAKCRSLANALLIEGSSTHTPLPSFNDIHNYTDRFIGLSSYWYTYEFFMKWAGIKPMEVYDPWVFRNFTERYCSSEWNSTVTDKYVELRCWGAAWISTILHDKEHGFGLDVKEYDAWRGSFRLPVTREMQERATWTKGAASLIAEHGKLVLCGHHDELALMQEHGRSTFWPSVHALSSYESAAGGLLTNGSGYHLPVPSVIAGIGFFVLAFVFFAPRRANIRLT